MTITNNSKQKEFSMKGAVQSNNNFTPPIKGWNAATFVGVITKSTPKGGTLTVAKFKVDGSKEDKFEEFSLTNANDEALLDVCNMVLKAFNKPEVKEGDNPEPTILGLRGKKCALLMLPTIDAKNGNTYMHTYKYGVLNFQGEIFYNVLPESAVGTKFEKDFIVGASGVGVETGKQAQPTAGKPIADDDVPFD